MKMIKILVVLVGVVMVTMTAVTFFVGSPRVQIVDVAAKSENIASDVVIPEEKVVSTAVIPNAGIQGEGLEFPATQIPTETLTPTATPEPELVREYILNEKINLSEGMIALNIRLDEQKILPGSWAEATSNQFVDRDSEFDPHNGTIYTVLGDTTVIGAHSGTIYGSPILFASNIDLYLRKDGQRMYGLDEGLTTTAGLIGKTAFVCQTNIELAKKLSQYNTETPCVGVPQELRIVSAGLVQEPMVEEYGQRLTSLRSFMNEKVPEARFDLLDPKTGFVLITCVGRYPDQPMLLGIPDFEYNRLVIGFEVVP